MDFKNFDTVMKKKHDDKLTVKQLAEALYEGTPHLQNLAEKLARQHGKAGALTFFAMMGEDVQNFFMHIAHQLIDFGAGWEENQGSACYSSPALRAKLVAMPRHPELKGTEEAKYIPFYSGMELIAIERREQIQKHGRTLESDVAHNGASQLLNAATHLIGISSVFDFDGTEDFVPSDWNADVYNKMTSKSLKERLVVAGALIAAEIDRLNNIEE